MPHRGTADGALITVTAISIAPGDAFTVCAGNDHGRRGEIQGRRRTRSKPAPTMPSATIYEVPSHVPIDWDFAYPDPQLAMPRQVRVRSCGAPDPRPALARRTE